MKKPPKPVKLTVYMPEEMRTALRIRALEEGMTATGLVERLIQTYLARPPKKASK